jgi:glyoxylase-like metal-dependent hydrolase (beta-lactamase superfamily II)
MKEILPGIYQMPLTLSGYNPNSVNIYIIKTPEGLLTVDTGWDSPPAIESMEKQLSEIGARFTDIKRVIITHCHIDHLGMIARLRKSHPVIISIPEAEIELIRIRYTGGDNYLSQTDAFLQNHGFPASELISPEFRLPISGDIVLVKPDSLFRGGEEIRAGEYTFKVINAPGHTPGHVVYYEPRRRFIISGDMLLPTVATNAAFHVQNIQNPLRKYLNSLQTLKELDIDMVLPGHEYVYTNPRSRIEELFRHHEEKATEIYKAFSDERPRTAYDVSRMLSWSPQSRITTWDKLSGWDKRFAVLQTIAHLEEMAYDKKLTRFSQDGKLYYQAK